MKASDNRYRSDLRRLHLAHRMMRLEARTSTIRSWTALSPFSIRTLHQAYTAGHYGLMFKRHRGVPPRHMRFFWRSAALRRESALLAGLCWAFGVLPRESLPKASEQLPNLSRGERLCEAFEAFIALIPKSAITIDHAVLLVCALAEGHEAHLQCCGYCGGLLLIDPLALEQSICPECLLGADQTTH